MENDWLLVIKSLFNRRPLAANLDEIWTKKKKSEIWRKYMKSDLNYDQKPLKILSSRNWVTDDHYWWRHQYYRFQRRARNWSNITLSSKVNKWIAYVMKNPLISGKSSENNKKLSWKCFSKICPSETMLNYGSPHSHIKLMHTTGVVC